MRMFNWHSSRKPICRCRYLELKPSSLQSLIAERAKVEKAVRQHQCDALWHLGVLGRWRTQVQRGKKCISREALQGFEVQVRLNVALTDCGSGLHAVSGSSSVCQAAADGCVRAHSVCIS